MIEQNLAQLILANPVSLEIRLAAGIPPAGEMLEAGAVLSLLGGNLAKEWVGDGVTPVVLAIDALPLILQREEYEQAVHEMKKIASGLHRLPPDLLKRASEQTVALLRSPARKTTVLTGVRYGSTPTVMIRLRILLGAEQADALDSEALPPHVADLKAEIAAVLGFRAGVRFEKLYSSSQKRPGRRICDSFFSLLNGVQRKLHPSTFQMFVAVFQEKWPELGWYTMAMVNPGLVNRETLKLIVRDQEGYVREKTLELLWEKRPELFSFELFSDFVFICGESAVVSSIFRSLAERVPDKFTLPSISGLGSGGKQYRDAVLALAALEVHYALHGDNGGEACHRAVLNALHDAATQNGEAAKVLRMIIEIRPRHLDTRLALELLRSAATYNDEAAKELDDLSRRKPSLFDTW